MSHSPLLCSDPFCNEPLCSVEPQLAQKGHRAHAAVALEGQLQRAGAGTDLHADVAQRDRSLGVGAHVLLNFKYLLLTRMDEVLFKYIEPKGMEKFMHGAGKPIRDSMHAVMQRVTDARGNCRLYRSILPVDMPRLAFNGYNSSFFSQLNGEIGALWLADLLKGGPALPPVAAQRATIAARLAWMEERTDGKRSKGTNIIPFSVHNIDELLQDMKLQRCCRWPGSMRRESCSTRRCPRTR